MGIEVKTPSMLVDELITANIKCFMAIDRLHQYAEQGDEIASGRESILVHKLNNRRNELMAALDRVLGHGNGTVMEKTYKETK